MVKFCPFNPVFILQVKFEILCRRSVFSPSDQLLPGGQAPGVQSVVLLRAERLLRPAVAWARDVLQGVGQRSRHESPDNRERRSGVTGFTR